MNKQILFIIILLAISVIGCERTWRMVGGVDETKESEPSYSTSPKVITLAEASHVEEVSASEKTGPDGKDLFGRHCAACHQVTGMGVPGVFPPLNQSSYVTGEEERLAAIIVYGLLGPIKVNGIQYNSAMAPLGAAMNDEELAAVTTYIRSAWQNKSDSVDASVFATVREKWGARGPFNITELGEES